MAVEENSNGNSQPVKERGWQGNEKMGARLDAFVHHREAVRLLVLSVFPSATIAFFNPASHWASSEGQVMGDDVLMQLHSRLNQQHSFSHMAKQRGTNDGRGKNGRHSSLQEEWLQAKRGPFSDCLPPKVTAAWRRLYRNWPPQPIHGRQPWRCEEEDVEVSASQSLQLPCWTPHAVVYIGGYEAPDLRHIVGPQLFAQVPPLSSDANETSTVGGEVFDYMKHKVPKFALKVLDEEILLRQKGCALHLPDLLEVAIPVVYARSNGPNQRMLTLLSFAGCHPNPNTLQLTEDPMRRAALRPAFGYSIAALKYALPPPVVGATRLLRRWNALWSANPLSAAFWLSTVGHAVERLSVKAKAGGDLLIGDGSPCHEQTSVNAAAGALAAFTALLLKEHPDVCMSNYFLPLEKFGGERGVMELMDVAGHLPVSRLCEVELV